MTTRRERLEGAMWGLLVGDAVGVPYEFHHASEIPAPELIEIDPPAGFARAHASAPRGAWSDDGAHALCLLAGLLWNDRLDVEDLMRRMTNWNELGYMAANGRVFDVGVQTSIALMNFRAGTPAIECGPAEVSSNGNGSLMRVLPLALWHRGSDEELVRDARTQSLPTHGHLRSQLCCALYCLWARRILEAAADPWRDAVETLQRVYAPASPERAELDREIRPLDDIAGRGSGYVVDSLRSARQCFDAGDYEAVVRAAIRLGNDTDTTAAIAGGIAGLRDGIGAIPARWREALPDTAQFEPLIAQLLDRA